MVTPNNTTLIQTLYALQPGTTSSNPFVNVYSLRDPTAQDINYPIQKRWVNFAQTKEWILENYISTSGFPLANWVLLSSGSSLAITLTGNTGGPVSPTANNINVVGDGTTITITGNPGTSTLTASLIGAGASVTKIGMQTGTSPVVPDGTGLITFNGAVVAAGTNPVRTDGTGANTMALEVQRAQDSPISDPTLVGLASFNDAQFVVDANGFVTIIGGGGPLDSINVDAFTPPGTDPVVPDGTGMITITGGQVAASVVGTNVIRTDSLAANTFTIEIQRSQAVAASTLADNGVSHFDSNIFTVDANGFVSSTAIIQQPGVQNIGFTYAAGVFRIVGANGVAFSASNPGYVTIPSVNIPGRNVTIKFTSSTNLFFQDSTSGGSYLAGNSFGVTRAGGLAYNQDLPFFVYAILNSAQVGAGVIETAATFMFSRYPNSEVSSVAGKIAKNGSAVASTQGSFFAIDSTVTVANYASSAALSIGVFRMQSTAAIADWTVQTLNQNDGIGRQMCISSKPFTLPTGAFGATAGKYFLDNGGTAPTFLTNGNTYVVSWADNAFELEFVSSVPVVVGVGVVPLQFALPFNTGGAVLGGCLGILNTNTNTTVGVTSVTTSPIQICQFFCASSNGAAFSNLNFLVNANFTGGTDALNFDVGAGIAFI